ncbi:MAG TPA: murein biosynthesis integral membrane protein MurJ [Abditibacteriaceae bacterium]|nr:murein biosynthesis integral membrane protein MurJ [Abditibacteriaceae bacterium]
MNLPLSDSSSAPLVEPKKVSTSRPLQAAVVLAGLYLLARLSGFLQLSLINALLLPKATDAYYAAFRLPDIINYLVAGGALSVTFIPIFTQLKQTEGERQAWRFFSTIATLMGLTLLVLIVFSYWLAGPLVRWTNPGFTVPAKKETLELTIQMTRIMLPAQLFFYLGGMVVGVLNAHKRFGISGMTGMVYNLVAISVGFVLWLRYDSGFAWGILVGACIGNFLLPLAAARSGPEAERIRFSPCFDWHQPAVRRFFTNAIPIMLGVSFPVVDQFIVGWFATKLPEGSLTHLYSAHRVMLAPLAIVGQAASVAAFPYLASDSAARDWGKFSEFLRTGLRRLMFLTLPLSIILMLTAQPIINIVYRHGNFTQAAADETATAFVFYCIGLFAWAGQQLVARGFYALQDTLTPTIIGTGLTIIFIIGAWVSTAWGVLGLALATSLGAMAHFACVLLALESKLKRRPYRSPMHIERIVGTLLRTGAACFVMGMAGYIADLVAVRHLADDMTGNFLRFLSVSAVATVAFALAAHWFAIPEWAWLRGKFLRPKRPRSSPTA